MSDINIEIDGGTSKRLLTRGKYCESDIVVTATDTYFDAFCDTFQQNGTRTDYGYAIRSFFNIDTLRLKYSIKFKNASEWLSV